MIVIKTKKDETFWTDSYIEQDGFLKFETRTKSGKKFTHQVNKDSVDSINDVGTVGGSVNDEEIPQ